MPVKTRKPRPNPRAHKRRRHPQDPPFYVLVPKGQDVTAKRPKYVADPERYQGPPILTDKLFEARRYVDRTGARKFFKRFPKLRKAFARILVK